LDERLSGIQNLRFHAMVYNVPSSIREQRIEEMLHMVELWDKRSNEVRTYSGGMKRRLELARGLLHHPKVLFLDEPTLGLDPQTRNRIWEYILEMRQQEGTTIFLTTHYMDEAEQADRIAIIDYGKLVAMDSPEKLKGIVSQDIISVKTNDNEQAIEEIRRRYQTEATRNGDEISFEVSSGEEFLPSFLKEFATKVLSVNLRQPSLDDVFLKLTGHEIRHEKVHDEFKALVRQHGRRMRH
ncbi:MAG: ATP-binding cassette domain-containing protein, partial [Chloroflexi bacterium]|nr:ATP-binding cassette domain-containing protein [Chloroflexota bacterium]